MNSLLDDNDEDIQDSHRTHAGRKQDREITLGTTMVLGIFFALAVFGAVMFGFGYSLGGKHAAATSNVASSDPNATFSNFSKPAPGRAGDAAKPLAPPTVTVPLSSTPPALPKPTKPIATPDPTEAEADLPVRTTPAPITRTPPSVAAVPTAVTPSAGGMMVQIAAVSHQEDADLLVSTLKRRSYAVAIHHEPQDQLLHVQVGPFPTRKDADAMRLRLQADGFNAIVKDPTH